MQCNVFAMLMFFATINPRTPYATYVSRNLNRPCCLVDSPIRLNFSVRYRRDTVVIYNLLIPPSTNFSFHYGKTYNHMLWKSMKSDCCGRNGPPLDNTHRNGGPFLPFFGQAGQVDPLVGWRCCY